jgi:hypothetical protein
MTDHNAKQRAYEARRAAHTRAPMQRAVTVTVRLANGEELTREWITVGACVAEYPWPKAVAWIVVPEVGAFW